MRALRHILLLCLLIAPALTMAAKRTDITLLEDSLAKGKLPGREELAELPQLGRTLGQEIARLIQGFDAQSPNSGSYRSNALFAQREDAGKNWEEFKKIHQIARELKLWETNVVKSDSERDEDRKKISDEGLMPGWYEFPSFNTSIRLNPSEQRVMESASKGLKAGWLTAATTYNIIAALVWVGRWSMVLQFSSCDGCAVPGSPVEGMWNAFAWYMGGTFVSKFLFSNVGDPVRRWFVRRATTRVTGVIEEAQKAFWGELAKGELKNFPVQADNAGKLEWLESKLSMMSCGASLEPQVRVEQYQDVQAEEQEELERKPRSTRAHKTRES